MTRPRKHGRTSREIKQELRAIYSSGDGKLPDLTRLSMTKRSPFRRFLIKIILVLFVLSVIVWSGFFFLSHGLFENKQETLKTSIETSDTIRSGEETTFTVRYENTGTVPIAALEVKMNLPSSFHLISAIPQPTSATQWTIGSLSAHSDGAIAIKGIFLAEVPSSQRIQALFTYKPANFNSNFQTIESKSIEMKESTIHLTMTGPEKALVGDSVTYTINLEHMGTDPIFNVRVIPTLPADFTIQSSDPKLDPQLSSWDIPSLPPGKLTAISFKGTYTSTASGTLPVGAKVGFMSEDSFVIQGQTDVKTDVLGGAVTFHLIINGSDKDQVAQLGKVLRGSIDYKNPGTDPVSGVAFTLMLDGTSKLPIDWDKADLSNGKRTGNTIRWSRDTQPALDKLAPGAQGTIDFSLPLLNNLPSGTIDTFPIKLSVDIAQVGSLASPRTIQSTPINVSLNSNTTLSAQARYFAEDGTPLGSGELPPRVGKTTSYRILWDLSNSLHELSGVDVATTLPTGVTWKDVSAKDTGLLTYNATTRQVHWQISKLPTDKKNVGAWFTISITPKKSDVGKFVTLTNQTTLQATDVVTKDQLNSTLPQLTTELPTDVTASGKGTVKE